MGKRGDRDREAKGRGGEASPQGHPFEALGELKKTLPAAHPRTRAKKGGESNPKEEATVSDEPSLPPPSPEPERAPDEVFSEAMGSLGVGELRKDGPERVMSSPALPVAPRGRRREVPEARGRPAEGDQSPLAEDELEDGVRETLRRVRAVERRRAVEQGLAPDDATRRSWPRLDLHGLSVDDALHELRRFVSLHRSGGTRMLRVVTGLGRHSAGASSPLREAVIAWLEASSATSTLRPAERADGGPGTLLVQLVARRRE